VAKKIITAFIQIRFLCIKICQNVFAVGATPLGSRADPSGGAGELNFTGLPKPLAGFKGPTSEEMGEHRGQGKEGKGTGRRMGTGREKGGKWMERGIPHFFSPLQALRWIVKNAMLETELGSGDIQYWTSRVEFRVSSSDGRFGKKENDSIRFESVPQASRFD